MATETLQKYGIEIGFEDAFKKVQKLRTVQSKINKLQEDSLSRQIDLQKRLNSLKMAGVSPKSFLPKTPKDILPTSPKTGKVRAPLQDSHVKARNNQLKIEQAISDQFKTHNLYLNKNLTEEEETVKAAMKLQFQEAKNAKEVRQAATIANKRLTLMRKQTQEARKQNFLIQRMTSSSKQLAGNMVGAFAVASGFTGMVRVGQDFEAVNNTMLAVSGNAENAAENFQFVKDEAFRLGLGLKESAKGFAKMKAAQGDMADQDLESIFIGVAEASTVLGLTAEEQSRSLNALVQMLSKGKISAEELRLQLGETMPTAIQDMAKAAQAAGAIDKNLKINDAVSAMLKLQEEGKLISSEILPFFGKQLQDSFGEGLKGALKSNRVAMNRFITSIQNAADSFFKGDFAEGLTNFFNEMAVFFKENEDLWKSLGKVIGSVFKGLSLVIKILTPVVKSLGSTFSGITNILGDMSALAIPMFTGLAFTLLPKTAKEFSVIGKIIGLINKKLKIMNILSLGLKGIAALAAIGFAEEVKEYWDPTEGKKSVAGTRAEDLRMREEYKKLPSGMGVSSYIRNADQHKFYNPWASEGGYVPYSNGSSKVEINVKGDVNVSGEKLGEIVMSTSSATETINRQMNSVNVGGY